MTLAFIDELQAAARDAEAAETAFRRDMAVRVAALEQERAFAYRRVNLMKAIAEAVAPVDAEEQAVAHALAMLRARLGWSSDSEARAAVLTRFVPVAKEVFASLSPNGAPEQAERRDEREPDVGAALSEFEVWYAQTFPTPFWTLFEHYIPETPRVDF